MVRTGRWARGGGALSDGAAMELRGWEASSGLGEGVWGCTETGGGSGVGFIEDKASEAGLSLALGATPAASYFLP